MRFKMERWKSFVYQCVVACNEQNIDTIRIFMRMEHCIMFENLFKKNSQISESNAPYQNTNFILSNYHSSSGPLKLYTYQQARLCHAYKTLVSCCKPL